MQPMQPMGGPFAPPGGPGPQGMSNGLPPGGMPNGIRQHPGGPGPGPGQMGGPGGQMGGPGGQQQQPGMPAFAGQPGPQHMMKMQSGAMAGVGGGMGIGGGMGLPPNIGAPMHAMSPSMAPHPGAPGMMQQGMQQGQPVCYLHCGISYFVNTHRSLVRRCSSQGHSSIGTRWLTFTSTV